MQDEFMNQFGTLLTLDDDAFQLVAEEALRNYKLELQKPSTRYLLTESMADYDQEKAMAEIVSLEKFLAEDTELSQIKKDFLKEFVLVTINTVIDTQNSDTKAIAIPIEFCSEDAKMPNYAHEFDSGMDVYSTIECDLAPGETKIIPTGIKVALPPGYEIQVRMKSGIGAKTKLRLGNQLGTIDSTYRGEIGVILENIEAPIQDITYERAENGDLRITSILHGKSYHIEKGQKIAQLVLAKVEKAILLPADSVSQIGDQSRGEGAYGSTGLK